MDLLTSVEEPSTPLQKELIERHVRSRTGGTIRDLQVEVNERAIIISGRAPTYYTKQLATHAVLDAACEPVQLTNNIEVY